MEQQKAQQRRGWRTRLLWISFSHLGSRAIGYTAIPSRSTLLVDLEYDGIYATGTLRVGRRGVPKAITQLNTSITELE